LFTAVAMPPDRWRRLFIVSYNISQVLRFSMFLGGFYGENHGVTLREDVLPRSNTEGTEFHGY
jgi:hypothetical protein